MHYHSCFTIILVKNPCTGPNPCQNGGACLWDPWKDHRYSCICVGNFGGQNCEIGKSFVILPPIYMYISYRLEWVVFYSHLICLWIENAINGGWSEWQAEGSCEGECEKGIQKYTRTCDNPTPNANGLPCPDVNVKSEECVIATPCPGRPWWPSLLNLTKIDWSWY